MTDKSMRRIGALNCDGQGCVITDTIPPTGAGMVRVAVKASLISAGTELSTARYIRANPAHRLPKPHPFGYQNAGAVIDTGSGVTGFKPGDRVACMGSGHALHTDMAIVPQGLCALLPEKVTFEQGAFAHLAMTSLHAIRRGQPELGEYLLVVGLGLVGQLAARFGQLAGMYVMGWDTLAFRAGIAQRWGIDATAVVGDDDTAAASAAFTGGLGFDMAVLAVGGDGTEALNAVQKVMKTAPDGHAMGRLCLVGAATTQCRWGAGLGNLDLRCCARTGPGYHDKDWQTGAATYPRTLVRWHTRANMELVLRLIAEGKLDVDCLVTHRLPLEKINDAVTAHVDNPGATLGTVLLYDND